MLATYDSFEAEEFTVALKDDCLPSSAASTVASSETDHLVDKETPENNGSLVDGFLKLLGFSSNPLAQQQNDAQTINNAAADMRLSMLSNFSSAYNIVSISLSLHIMDHIYSATAQDESICSSALIAGMIIGQFGGGTLGDVLGRHRAMGLVRHVAASRGVLWISVLCAFISTLYFSGVGYMEVYLGTRMRGRVPPRGDIDSREQSVKGGSREECSTDILASRGGIFGSTYLGLEHCFYFR